MHIRPIVQAPKHSGNSSLAVTAAGLFGFAVLISGLWHPKFPDGGVTQIGRDASVTFEDGSVLTLSEPESDLDILRRRRMAGWGGHEFQQTFIKSDGTEMEVINDNRAYMADDGDDLDSGDQFMLTAYHKRGGKAGAPLDQKEAGIVVADMHVDGKDKVITEAADPKDRVVTDVIDNKDKVVFDPKDSVEQPVFALTTTDSPYLDNQGILGILMGDPGSMWGSPRTITPGGGLITGGGGTPGGGGGTVTTPPIGTAVPEPGTWSLVGLAGVAALAVRIRRRKTVA